MNKQVTDLWDELSKKIKERDKTQKQLDASMSIQLLWPDAFKHGSCTSYLGGNLNEFDTMHFIIKNGNGETKEFSLIEIPDHILERAIKFQKGKPNGHNDWQRMQLDRLYKYIKTRKRINERKTNEI